MKNLKKLKEIYISVDIEANGPIPGEYSMSSFGAFAAGALNENHEYIHFDYEDEKNVFYSELSPISPKFIPSAIKVGLLEGFDQSQSDESGQLKYDWSVEHGCDPHEELARFAEWCKKIEEVCGAPVVFMGYPAGFDWMFLYWYLVKFEVESPFGFSRMLDLKSVFSIKGLKPIKHSTKRNMPKSLFSKLPHTHRADQDAVEQGIMGINVLQWAGR